MVAIGALAFSGHDDGSWEGIHADGEPLYLGGVYDIIVPSYLDNHIWQLLYIAIARF